MNQFYSYLDNAKNLVITNDKDMIKIKPLQTAGELVVSFDNEDDLYHFIVTSGNKEYRYKLAHDNHIVELYMPYYIWHLQECEHDGDVNAYVNNIKKAGADIVDSGMHDAVRELGYVVFKVDSYDVFSKRYNELKAAFGGYWFI